MIIRESSYKDLFAIELETEKYIAKVIPSEGAKLASFKAKKTGREYLLQNQGEKYNTLGLEKDYEKSECSGFDDMFPTIDKITIAGADGKDIFHPDHGEVCRLPFNYKVLDGKLLLFCRSNKLGYEYEKTLSEGADGRITIDYKITNVNNVDMLATWTAHCLINAEIGGELILPYDEGQDVDIMADYNKKLPVGERIAFKKELMSTVCKAGLLEMRKYYFPTKPENGRISYRYTQGEEFVMEFDEDKLPIVGIWINYGVLNGYYCIGIEPSTSGYDTVIGAKKKGIDCTLKPNQPLEFSINLLVE